MNLPPRTLEECRHLLLEIVKVPRFANLFITTACTCRCVMCNSWRLEKSFMSLSLFRRSVDVLEDLGFYNFSLTGGEPLAHPRYFAFVSYLKNKGFYVSSPTNGTLLTERNVLRLKECGIDSVNVSIDSLNQKTSGKVRGHPGQLRKALIGLDLLGKHDIPSSAIILLGKHNIDEFGQMIKTLNRVFDVPCILSFPDPGVGPINEIHFTKDELVKVIHQLLELKKQGYRLQNTSEYLLELERDCLGKPRRILCYGGYYVINVHWDGTVKPCFNKKSIGYITELNELHKTPCTRCLNQCFIEFSYIIECLNQKRFLVALKEWWPSIKAQL